MRQVEFSHEVVQPPEYDVPELLVLDFDRMLSDTDVCTDRLQTIVADYGIDAAELNEAAAAAKNANDGGSYEPLSYIAKRLNEIHGTDSAMEQVRQRFVTDEGTDVLYPDAHRFLRRINEAGIPHVVMTYGISAEWQRLKLQAAGYPIGFTITDTPDKGAALQRLQNPETGKFDLHDFTHNDTLYHADRLTFLDDKAIAFSNLPQNPDFRGFWIQRGTLTDNQKGTVPPNVAVIQSLDQLILDQDGVTLSEHGWYDDYLGHFQTRPGRFIPGATPHSYVPHAAIAESEPANDIIFNARSVGAVALREFTIHASK